MKRFLTSAFRNAAAGLTLVATLALAAPVARASEHEKEEEQRDRVILSFSTVGDSRQDPDTPDPTTLPLSGQDALWLQNTRVLDRISRSVEMQRSSLLFFNGDMIMGYG